MRSTFRFSNSSSDAESIKEKIEIQNQPRILPTYAIILIVISCIVLFGAFIYLLYRKNKNKSSTKNRKTKFNRPIHEVWASPDMDNTVNIITFDKTNCSNAL
ncbi:hypothetical protein CONCODRAFT_76599 [Conidiobolus coronatus NRRL 28638]|uniref:Uncharacterized protein n=1 Tax=Conidiobolus coronatus (strain ATCC 28846 / CBS 209.66 / NRRL 28638) TaxID=796925 RepID=A0A137PIM8_CONC2|nr:hypothetical protein CONCODRAFT_76599 [Conidiobolus coronatus NRRL 28638]|eukprot:KXN74856.1 hypothetical protein CONCODRAFT_76599 [Conidiobolus coronatus NRRL 28638]